MQEFGGPSPVVAPQPALRFAPLVGLVLRRWPSRAVRGAQALARLEANHPTDPPHWYLAAIAAWYARLGFDVEVEEPCFPGGPPQWFMRRTPAG